MCNCRVTEIVLGLVILLFSLWETSASKWILVIAALVLIFHALICKKCVCSTETKTQPKKGRRR